MSCSRACSSDTSDLRSPKQIVKDLHTHRDAIARHRDALRELKDEINEHLDSFDRGLEELDYAIDALSDLA